MNELLFDHGFADALVARDSNPRWRQIDQTASFVVSKLEADKAANLVFICTHNSRRSQFAHVWAEVFARAYELDDVHCYSGGIEVTECNPRTVAALERVGFQVSSLGGPNPDYEVKYSEHFPPVVCNSSLFADQQLADFAAMMCCADVDQKCPAVPGAEIRIPWYYDDPKEADDTPEESTRYDERCRQIGRDMLLVMAVAAERRKSADSRV